MRQAKALAERLAGGEAGGPLAGLPLGVKDLENAAGFVTTKGSRLYRDNRVDFDDAHVARLKAAGAIIVGKTNTPEFGHIPFTDNELFGSTLNPWNLERTPGGSSGGSSAALASGMVPLATASDGGGSIRIPACYTGLYGLKPSQGRTPIAPRPMPTWLSISCYGPLTRSVRDAAIYLDVVAGPDPRDPESLPAPDVSYAETLEEPLPKLRIAFNETLGVTTRPAGRAARGAGGSGSVRGDGPRRSSKPTTRSPRWAAGGRGSRHSSRWGRSGTTSRRATTSSRGATSASSTAPSRWVPPTSRSSCGVAGSWSRGRRGCSGSTTCC